MALRYQIEHARDSDGWVEVDESKSWASTVDDAIARAKQLRESGDYDTSALRVVTVHWFGDLESDK